MRPFLAAALAALALVVSGCGSSSVNGTAHGATLDGDAAKLVPSNAVAFVSVDSDLNSSQWQRVDTLVKSFTNGMSLIDELNSKLKPKGLTWKDDVAPAVGSEVDVAILPSAATPEVVAFTHPGDESKLSALVAKLGKNYSVQQIGGWSVVADSQDSFNAVRSAQSGQSLADNSTFTTAWSSVAGDSLARAYVNGAAKTENQTAAEGSHPDWIAARVNADASTLRVDAVVKPHGAPPAVTGDWLLGDVPSGAALAVAFHGMSDLSAKLSSLQLPKGLAQTLPLKQLGPLLAGGGVVYLRPNGLLPDIAVELAPKDPRTALATVQTVIKGLGTKLGPLQLTAKVAGNKLVIADSPAAAAALRGGSKLVDDAAYKDALSKAGVPAQTSFLVYADVSQLAPFIPIVVQAVTGKAPDPALAANLAHVGTVVAWGTRSGGRVQLHAWLQPR